MGRSRLGGPSCSCPCSVRHWYVGLRPALGLDMLPELVPFAIKKSASLCQFLAKPYLRFIPVNELLSSSLHDGLVFDLILHSFICLASRTVRPRLASTVCVRAPPKSARAEHGGVLRAEENKNRVMITMITTLIEHMLMILNASPFVFKTVVISYMQTEK